MSKDLKLITILLGIEFIILSVLAAVAIKKYTGKASAQTDRSGFMLNAELSDRVKYNGEPVLITASPAPTGVRQNTPTPAAAATPAPVLYNYYTFDFSKSGYTVKRSEATLGQEIPGLTFEGLKESELTVPKSKSYFVLGNLIVENNYVGKDLPLTELLARPLVLPKISSADGPRFLVYYTHTYEGYCLLEEEKYEKKRWYTSTDSNVNVVAAGTAFYDRLTELGIPAINDTTVHNDGADALISYELSYKTLVKDLEENPNVLLTLDFHRNGYGKLINGKLKGPTAEKDGVVYAKVMFVVGLDYDDDQRIYNQDVNPHWMDNLKLVMAINSELEARVPGITSQISLRRTPYNQGLAPNGILAEVGFEGNLVSEAQNTTRLLAEIIADLYS